MIPNGNSKILRPPPPQSNGDIPIASPTTNENTTYNKALKDVEAVLSERKNINTKEGIAAPGSIGELIVEDTFSLLHHSVLYSGMGEEAITASFATALAAAGLMWKRQWIWIDDLKGEDIIWNHYSSQSETVLGADFSLVLVDMKDNEKRYRIVVAQAKKHTASTPDRLNVKRKAFSTLNSDSPKDWESTADTHLRSALKDGATQGFDPGEPNWQLTRLLTLNQQLVKANLSAAIVFVVWPMSPDKDTGAFNSILYEELSTALTEITKSGPKPNGSYLQSFQLNSTKTFREFLLNYEDLKSMSEGELLKALPIIKAQSAATILINASGQVLSPDVKEAFRHVNKPDYEPAIQGPSGKRHVKAP